jgi:hypothetical protein
MPFKYLPLRKQEQAWQSMLSQRRHSMTWRLDYGTTETIGAQSCWLSSGSRTHKALTAVDRLRAC